MKGYLSDKVLFNDSENHKAAMQSIDHELLLEGPARCGKTGTSIRKLLALHAKNKGMRSCVVRMNSVDLTDTIKFDIRELYVRYGFDDPRSQIKQQGGLTRFDHLYLNSGEMRFGGMNRPSSVLGGQYSVVYLNELSEFTEEAYMMLKHRCSGSAAEWRGPGGEVRFQMLADTNPTVEDFWAYKREAEGLLRTIHFGFQDNPFFYRKQRWSRVGKDFVEELDRSLVGIWHDIYFKGSRVALQGAVFRLHEKNIIKREAVPPLSECNLDRACDWGQTHPSICLWIAQHKETQNIYVFREWRKTHSDILEMGDQMNAFSEGEEIQSTVIDWDENRQILLQRVCKISSVMAPKGPNSIMDGLFMIQAALRKAVEGKNGGLYLVEDAVCNTDPNPGVKDKPNSLIAEMKRLVFDENRDKPVNEGDDAVDALRYYFLWKYRHTDLDLPAILGKVKLGSNKRESFI